MTAPRKLAHSHSSIDQFDTCEHQWYEERIAKTIKFEENEHTSYGKKVHKAIEDNLLHGKQFPLGMAHLAKQVAPFKEATGDKYGEQKLAVDYEFHPCDWFDKTTYFRVIMDYLIINGNKAVLVDWKTGKVKDGFQQLQLAAAVLMIHQPNIERVDSAYVWLRDKKITPCRIYKDDIPEIWETILPKVKRIQKAVDTNKFRKKPSGLCKRFCRAINCEYKGV